MSGEAGAGCRVVRLKNVPDGFEENEMRRFFSQFGSITRLRLKRSRKSGRPVGLAYIEFKLAAVANVVAKAMDNYMMFGTVIKCRLYESDSLPRKFFQRGVKGPVDPNRFAIREKARREARKALRVTPATAAAAAEKRKARQQACAAERTERLRAAGLPVLV